MMHFFKMFWKICTVWKIKPANEEELKSADVIVSFSDSKMIDGSLGPGNEIIGQVTEKYQTFYNLPVMAQEEAAVSAAQFGAKVQYISIGTQDGKSYLHWNTAIIMDYVAAFCYRNNWNKLIIVSIPDHMPRCVWCAEKRGLKAFAASMPSKGQYFHKNLALPSCRGGSFRFRFRDFFVRILFLLQGNI
ncbi:MAG: hypothetical protein HYW79_02320 [Parcubacteria group bacterium]|nr:hypothetical protein [Parcubacteria group bacterium]